MHWPSNKLAGFSLKFELPKALKLFMIWWTTALPILFLERFPGKNATGMSTTDFYFFLIFGPPFFFPAFFSEELAIFAIIFEQIVHHFPSCAGVCKAQTSRYHVAWCHHHIWLHRMATVPARPICPAVASGATIERAEESRQCSMEGSASLQFQATGSHIVDRKQACGHAGARLVVPVSLWHHKKHHMSLPELNQLDQLSGRIEQKPKPWNERFLVELNVSATVKGIKTDQINSTKRTRIWTNYQATGNNRASRVFGVELLPLPSSKPVSCTQPTPPLATARPIFAPWSLAGGQAMGLGNLSWQNQNQRSSRHALHAATWTTRHNAAMARQSFEIAWARLFLCFRFDSVLLVCFSLFLCFPFLSALFFLRSFCARFFSGPFFFSFPAPPLSSLRPGPPRPACVRHQRYHAQGQPRTVPIPHAIGRGPSPRV